MYSNGSNFFPLWILIIKVLFTSDNLFWVDDKLFLEVKNHLLSPQNKLSDVNKTFIDLGNGQKFEL